MDAITIDGLTFPPVLIPSGTNHRGQRVLAHAQVNGRPLYAVPGGLMAYADDLPRVAATLAAKSTGVLKWRR